MCAIIKKTKEADVHMKFSNYRFSLDIHETASQVYLSIKQGDTGRKIHATLMENGMPFEITSDCTVKFATDKTGFTPEVCIVQNNVIQYTISPAVSSIEGMINCEFKLYSGGNLLLTSPQFIITVDDTVYSEEASS